MTWLLQQIVPSTFFSWVSMLVQAFTWPAAAVLIARMFRGEVRQVLDRVVRLKFQDFEADFLHELAESEELAALPSEPVPHLQNTHVFHELSLADCPQPPFIWPIENASPRMTIDRAWKKLLGTCGQLAESVHQNPVQSLASRSGMSGPSLVLFDRLRRMHQAMTSRTEWDPTLDEARLYDELAHRLADKIRRR